MNDIRGRLEINGEGGNNSLRIFDQGTPAPVSYTIGNDSIRRDGIGLIRVPDYGTQFPSIDFRSPNDLPPRGNGPGAALNVGWFLAGGRSLPTDGLTQMAGDRLNIEMAGNNPGVDYDQIETDGPIQLAGTLKLDFLNGYVPATGDTFTIIDNTADPATDSIYGEFDELPEEGTFIENGVTFEISYEGGDGNDVVLTVLSSPSLGRPILDTIGNRSVTGGTPITFTATASDPGSPSSALTYSLRFEPAGASIAPDTGEFSWTPPTDQAPGSYTFAIRVTDDRGLYDEETVVITILAVNHAPVGTTNTVTTIGAMPYIFRLADFGFSDPDDVYPGNNFNAVEITTLPSAGILTDNGALVTPMQFVSASDINAGLLIYTPTGIGTSSSTFQVQDDGGIANGGIDTDPTPRTMTINVTQWTPTVSVVDNDGTFDGSTFTATATVAGVLPDVDDTPASSLEGVGLTLTYYSGTDTTGTPLSGAPSQAGTYTVVASFAGSIDYASASDQVTFIIARNNPIVSVSDAGGTFNGSAYAGSATVAGRVAGVDDSPASSLEGVTPTFTYYAGSSATGTPLPDAPVQAGTYTVVASFAGSVDYDSATSDPATFTISPSETSTSITTAPATSVLGQTIVIAAHVSAVSPGGGIPSGTIDFLADGTIVASKTLDTLGNAIAYASDLPVGTHAITASYEGSGNFNGSSSTAVTQTVTTNVNSTTTTVSSNLAPSYLSQNVTFTATVTADDPSLGTPQGWVVFYDGATNVGQAVLTDGVANFTISTLSVGQHSILAVYAGDTTFDSSSATPLLQTVYANSTVTLLASSLDPANYGEDVTFMASVVIGTPVTGPPSGWIVFYDNGDYLSQVALDNTGEASFTTHTLSVGTHVITAAYMGDGIFDESWSDPLTQTIVA